MTITLTKEELEEFANKLKEWHAKRADYILNHCSFDRFSMRLEPDVLIKARRKFDEENPCPDWRSLL